MKDVITLLALALTLLLVAPCVAASDAVREAWSRRSEIRKGMASWYGEEHRGRPMANGKPFNPRALTCASWDYPLGTILAVRCPASRRGVVVVVTDRGPNRVLWRRGRILDLSHRAFEAIANPDLGLVEVEVSEVKGRK